MRPTGGLNLAETILQEADRLINNEKRSEYGGKVDGFISAAALWDSYLKNRDGGYGAGIAPRDVIALMILWKVRRVGCSVKRDTWTDIAGYAGLGAVIDGFDPDAPKAE